jgi:hypothetical protein
MARDIKKYVKGVGVKPVTTTGITEKGEIESLDASGKLNYHNGTTASPVVTEAHAATLSNKTITAPIIAGGSITSATIGSPSISGGTLVGSTLNNPIISSPTGITSANVGLGNVDNTSDLDKPVSTATQTALDDKANETLNNLTTTSINADLVPDTDNSRALGSDSVNWTVVNTRSVVSNEDISLTSGDTSASSTGNVSIKSKNLPASGTTGDVSINSGTQSSAAGASGNVTITSGPAVSSTGSVIIGSANATGTSGGVSITTGNGAGATGNITLTTGAGGSRGAVLLSGSSVNVQGSKLTGLPLPVDTSDAASKAYVDNNTLSNNTPNEINSLTVKATPVNADVLLIEDSADSFNKKKVTVGSLSTGGGDINFLQLSNVSWNAESGTTGFVTYKDAAAARPENGVDGTATLVSITTSATAPLTGSNSLHIVKASGNAQGEGVSAAFDIDNANQARVLKVEFDYNIVSGVFTAGTQTTDSSLIVYLYDTVNNVLIEPSTFKLFSNSTTIADKFQGTFQTSSNSTAYRLIFHVATSATDAFTVRIDSVVVTPSKYVFGTPITDWQDYSPTLVGFGTPTNTVIRWRRVGQNLELSGRFSSGTSTAVAAAIPFPSGLVANTGSVTFGNIYGRAVRSAGVSAYSRDYSMIVTSSGTGLNFGDMNPANSSDPASPMNGSSIAGSGQTILFKAEVPIQGWSSSVKMSDGFETRDVIFQAYPVNGANFSTAANIEFGTNIIQDTVGGYNSSTHEWRVPVTGQYMINVNTILSNQSQLRLRVNGVANQYIFHNPSSGSIVNATSRIKLNAGDLISFRFETFGSTITSSANLPWTIERLSTPQSIARDESTQFKGFRTTSQVLTANVTDIIMTDKSFDSHGAYNTSNGRFTAPTRGLYLIVVNYGTNGNSNLLIYKNGGSFQFGMGGANGNHDIGNSGIIELLAGDYITLRSNTSITISSGTNVTIVKVG